jgi:hypothetical protein
MPWQFQGLAVEAHQLQIASTFHEDSRAVIAALKVHRAEAAKWAITINLALAAAATLAHAPQVGGQLEPKVAKEDSK